MNGTLVRALGGGETVRVVAVEARGPADAARVAHDLLPGAATIAAEGLVATVLLSALVKGDERIALQVQASDPPFAFIGEVDAEGNVRARLTPRDAHGVAIDGVMLAIKSDATRELYRGMTEIRRQSLEEALREHVVQSAQVDAVLRLGARVDGTVKSAYGLYIERLPADRDRPTIAPAVFHQRYAWLADAPLEEVMTTLALGRLEGPGHPAETLHVLETRPIVWKCRCSLDRVEATLAALGATALREMIDEDGGAEVTCHFCNAVYRVPAERLEELFRAIAAPEA